MENMDKGLDHSTKMGADKSTKVSQMPQNLSAQIVCLMKKGFIGHLSSVY